MSEARLVFSQTVEGFIRGLGAQLTPELRSKLREAGLDVDRKLEPAYPAEKWASWIRLACTTLFPGMPDEGAQRAVGAQFIRGYNETLVGKAMLALCRVIGPAKTLARMERNFRTGNNYIRTQLTTIGPTEVELWFNEVDGLPGYYAGIIDAAAKLVDFRGTHADIIRHDGSGCVYRVTWSA